MNIKNKNLKTATFAGGCFWCTENAFKNLPGVIEVISGYSGGFIKNPSYEMVSTGESGHYEAIQVKYDPHAISYKKLLEFFWKQIDPTDAIGQFSDVGSQYRTAIFYHNIGQKKLAEASKEEINQSGILSEPAATKILPYKNFYPAEEFHQNYAKKNPERYQRYAAGSRRQDKLKNIWQK